MAESATLTDTAAQSTSDGTVKTTGATGTGMQPASAATQEEHADTSQVTLSRAELEEMITNRLARDRKARAEAARKQQQAATRAEAGDDATKLREALEQAETEREQTAAALRAERVSRLAEREAAGAHAVYPDLVALLLEKDLEFEDGSDRPSNLNTLLGQLRRRYPLLFHAPSGDGGAGGGTAQAAGGSSMNTLIRQMAGRR